MRGSWQGARRSCGSRWTARCSRPPSARAIRAATCSTGTSTCAPSAAASSSSRPRSVRAAAAPPLFSSRALTKSLRKKLLLRSPRGLRAGPGHVPVRAGLPDQVRGVESRGERGGAGGGHGEQQGAAHSGVRPDGCPGQGGGSLDLGCACTGRHLPPLLQLRHWLTDSCCFAWLRLRLCRTLCPARPSLWLNMADCRPSCRTGTRSTRAPTASASTSS